MHRKYVFPDSFIEGYSFEATEKTSANKVMMCNLILVDRKNTNNYLSKSTLALARSKG
jgi:hypothetical protein